MNIMLQLCEGEFLKMTHLQFLPFLRRLGDLNYELNKTDTDSVTAGVTLGYSELYNVG